VKAKIIMKTQLFVVTLFAAICAATALSSVGFKSHERKFLDSWSNAIYIPNLESRLSEGFVKSYNLYARRSGEIILQVWRHVSGSTYKLITQTEHKVTASGEQTVNPSELVHVEEDDVIGFYFPGNSIIPFDGNECGNNPGLYVRSPHRPSVVPGKTFSFSKMQRGWNPCRQYSFSVEVIPGSGVITGFASNDRKFLDSWSNAMYIPNEHSIFKADGIISDYSLFARRPGTIVLQVWRHKGATSYELVTQTPFKVPSAGVHTVHPKDIVAVETGDVLGFYFPGNSIIPFDGHECSNNPGLYVRSPTPASVTPGKTFKFSKMQRGWNPCRQYAFSARIIPGELTTEGFSADTNRKFLDTWSNAIYIPNAGNHLPDGLLTSYSLYARRPGTIILQVWRQISGSTYQLVDTTRHVVSRTGKNTVHPDELLAVEAGDVLGFYFPGNSIIPFDGRECTDERGLYVRSPKADSVIRGKHFRFSNMQKGWNPCRKYSFSAEVLITE